MIFWRKLLFFQIVSIEKFTFRNAVHSIATIFVCFVWSASVFFLIFYNKIAVKCLLLLRTLCTFDSMYGLNLRSTQRLKLQYGWQLVCRIMRCWSCHRYTTTSSSDMCLEKDTENSSRFYVNMKSNCFPIFFLLSLLPFFISKYHGMQELRRRN